MAFGKRSVSTGAAAPNAAPQGRQRILPAEAWEGETGKVLRELGLAPDDESNLVPNAQSLRTRLDHGRAAIEAKTAKLNAEIKDKTAGGALRPFFLIPDSCWTGESGQLLMLRLDLFPYDAWNVAFLPVDARTASLLDMPVHPNGNIPAFVVAADKFMRQADAHLRAAHAEAGRTRDLARFGETYEDIRLRVRALAQHFLAQLDEAWRKHNAVAAPVRT